MIVTSFIFQGCNALFRAENSRLNFSQIIAISFYWFGLNQTIKSVANFNISKATESKPV